MAGSDDIAAPPKPKPAELATAQATDAVQACGGSSPTDKQVLDQHLQALDKHEAKYKQRRDEAEAAGASKHAVGAHKAKLTEALGERAATQHMLENFGPAAGDYKMLWGFASGIGIDQLWYSEKEKVYIIVEAKGPGAKLATGANKGDQMSQLWVENSLNEVAYPKVGQCDPSDKAHIEAMQEAMLNGPLPEVRGLVLEAELGGGSAKKVACPNGGIYHAT